MASFNAYVVPNPGAPNTSSDRNTSKSASIVTGVGAAEPVTGEVEFVILNEATVGIISIP